EDCAGMRIGLLDEIATEAIERYRIFQRSLEALFSRAALHPDMGTPAFRKETDAAARAEAASYLAREARAASSVLLSVAIEARRTLKDHSSVIARDSFSDA